ncbi:hypothetical protein XELAEV_18020439mg [Xenopus laevis]|uniref:Uncharacterized protein n=1 Tax=Xenopus laevis TaxID=8355 RepID=A0A974HQN8_XENLA|nr:hypothetical protein XELAEV_18020439mg [Xenopus laevis]
MAFKSSWHLELDSCSEPKLAEPYTSQTCVRMLSYINCWWDTNLTSLADNLKLVQGVQETFTGFHRTKPSASLILLVMGDVVLYLCIGAFGYIPRNSWALKNKLTILLLCTVYARKLSLISLILRYFDLLQFYALSSKKTSWSLTRSADGWGVSHI